MKPTTATPTVAELRADDVVRTYRRTVALDGVTLSFGAGTSVLLGRNGAGKSTLVRLLVGIDNPTSGTTSLLVDGTAVCGNERLAQIGWLPQTFGFPTRMKVRDFVAYGGWLKGMHRRDAAAATGPALEFADVADKADSHLGELSGGTLRRVGLAVAVVHKPAVLILDEPTTGLDPIQRSGFHARLQAYAQNSTVLLATHLLEDVDALADSVHVIDAGRVVWEGTKTQLAQRAPSLTGTEALRAALVGLVGPETHPEPDADPAADGGQST